MTKWTTDSINFTGKLPAMMQDARESAERRIAVALGASQEAFDDGTVK